MKVGETRISNRAKAVVRKFTLWVLDFCINYRIVFKKIDGIETKVAKHMGGSTSRPPHKQLCALKYN